MRQMKDSEVEWIGEIPEDWCCIKTSYLVELYTGNSIKNEEKSKYECSIDAIPYIATKDIQLNFNQVNYENGMYVKESDKSFKRAHAKDTLMCIEGGSAGKKKAMIDKECAFVNKLCCFHAIDIDPQFLYYVLNSPHYEAEFFENVSGLIGGVGRKKLSQFYLPVPCIDEQKRIADFLDEKCSKIDAAIAKQEQLIEKLKEYKQSLITEIVTKGLDPNAKMKPSGIDWIGDIPSHWGVCRLKNYANIMNGKDYKNIENENGDYPVLGSGGIFAYCDEYLYDQESVLLGRKGTIDCPLYVDQPFWTVDTMYYTKVNDSVFPKYFYYLCTCINFDYFQYGSAVPSMTQRDLNSVIFPKPDIKEQQYVAYYLDEKCSQIECFINQFSEQISKLHEYKKSLIYEYVTGKKEIKYHCTNSNSVVK